MTKQSHKIINIFAQLVVMILTIRLIARSVCFKAVTKAFLNLREFIWLPNGFVLISMLIRIKMSKSSKSLSKKKIKIKIFEFF